jgi:HEAT repeats/PBS lyase HEAT-like repeat
MVLCCAWMAGCEADPYRPKSDSILDYLQGPTPQYAAEMAVDKYDADRRYRGTVLLASASFAGEKVYMELFRSYTRDEDAAVRGAAARAIGNHGTPEDATYLISMLDDENEIVRREAARGLQRLHNPGAIDPLKRKLDTAREAGLGSKPEDDAQVRAEAALALGQYGKVDVIEVLIASLDDPQLAVNRSSLASLRTLTGQDLGFSRAAWTLWMDEQKSPLLGRAVFVYRGYQRRLKWYEYIPFVRKPQFESAGVPAGYPLPQGL